MLYEIDAFGIKATLVEPGHVRLDESTALHDASHPGVVANDKDKVNLRMYGHFLVKSPSGPYNTPTAPSGHARRVVQWLAGKQPTSAIKAAELVWQLGHCRYPPLRLLLGTFAVESIRDRLKSITEEIEDWKHLSFQASTDENTAKDEKSNNSQMVEDDQAMELYDDAADMETTFDLDEENEQV